MDARGLLTIPVIFAIFAFHRSEGTDALTSIALVLGLLFIPAFLFDRFASPPAVAWAASSRGMAIVFGIVTAIALPLAMIATPQAKRDAGGSIALFLMFWFYFVPWVIGGLFLADRVFKRFQPAPLEADPAANGLCGRAASPPPQADTPDWLQFDPNRFK